MFGGQAGRGHTSQPLGAGRHAGRQAGRQAGVQAGRQAALMGRKSKAGRNRQGAHESATWRRQARRQAGRQACKQAGRQAALMGRKSKAGRNVNPPFLPEGRV